MTAVVQPRANANRFGTNVVVGMTALAVGVGASLGFLYGFLAPEIREFFGVDRARAGLLVSAYFGATGVMSILSGFIADRVSAKRVVAAAIGVLAVMVFVAAGSNSYWTLLLVSILGGACYAPINTGTNVALANVVPLEKRGAASNAKTMGVPLLVSFGAFFAPVVGQAFSWRVPLIACGIVAVVAFVAALVIVPNVTSIKRGEVGRKPPKGFWRVPIAAFFLLIGSQPVYSWSISFLVEDMNVGKFQAGSVVGVASLMGAVNMVLLGRMSDRLGLSSRRTFLMALTLTLSLSQFVITTGHRLWLGVIIVAVAMAIITQLAAIGTMHALIIDLCPGAAGRGSGLTMTGYYLGALAAPVSFGFITDRVGYPWAWAYCGVCAALSMLFFWSTKWVRRDAPVTTVMTARA